MDAALRLREAVRAVVLTDAAEVLLVRFEFPAGTRWALPGGGIDAGEAAIEALHRELAEEVGLHDACVGAQVWDRVHVIPFLDGRFDGQHERIHVVRVARRFEPQPGFTWEQLRAEYVHELRWWTIDEIEAAGSTVFAPAALARHLRALVTDGDPSSPVDVGV